MLVGKGLSVATTRKPVVTAQDVAAAIAPPDEATPSLARVLLDFTVSGQATLFLIDPPRGRVYVRRMALAHGLDAVARASVRFVIEQSIDAILEGREIGVSRDEFQRSGLSATPARSPAPLAPPAPLFCRAGVCNNDTERPLATPTQAAGHRWLPRSRAMGSAKFQHAALWPSPGASNGRDRRWRRAWRRQSRSAPAPGPGRRPRARARRWHGPPPRPSEVSRLLTSLGAGVDFTRVAPSRDGGEPAARARAVGGRSPR